MSWVGGNDERYVLPRRGTASVCAGAWADGVLRLRRWGGVALHLQQLHRPRLVLLGLQGGPRLRLPRAGVAAMSDVSIIDSPFTTEQRVRVSEPGIKPWIGRVRACKPLLLPQSGGKRLLWRVEVRRDDDGMTYSVDARLGEEGGWLSQTPP